MQRIATTCQTVWENVCETSEACLQTVICINQTAKVITITDRYLR